MFISTLCAQYFEHWRQGGPAAARAGLAFAGRWGNAKI